MKRSRILFLIGVLSVLAFAGGLFVDPAWAQSAQELETFAQRAGFGTEGSLTLIIARLIRTVISFIGIILVVFIVYGGIVWMTAGGNVERVNRAKKILLNAVIGLVIALMSFAIVQFALTAFDFGGSGGRVNVEDDAGPGGGPFNDGGRGNRGQFVLTSVNTSCSVIQNMQLQMVFSESVRSSTVLDDEGIDVRVEGGDVVDGTFRVQGSRVTFTPAAVCQDNESERCFSRDTSYEVSVKQGVVKSRGGRSLVCGGDTPCEYSFRVGSGIDVTPPEITMDAPDAGASVIAGQGAERLQARTVDDIGVSTVGFEVNGDVVFQAGLSDADEQSHAPVNFFNSGSEEWNTDGYATNRRYGIRAEALDCAGHTRTSDAIAVTLRSVNCGNGVQDEELGETGIDCGGSSQNQFYCGACAGESCESTDDCSPFHTCENGQCVGTVVINRVSPGDGAVGNLITLSGGGFGEEPGRVVFMGSIPEDEVIVSPFVCQERVGWSDQQIVVEVPEGVRRGPIRVETADGATDRTDDEHGPHIAQFEPNEVVRPGLCLAVPDRGITGSQVLLFGKNFGEERGESTVYFGSHAVQTYSDDDDHWNNDQIEQIRVPLINASRYALSVFVGSDRCEISGEVCSSDTDCPGDGDRCLLERQGSNSLFYTVDSVARETTPTISFVDSGWKACSQTGLRCATEADCEGQTNSCVDTPDRGPREQYVTIFGSNFGSSPGRVLFINDTDTNNNGQQALGLTDFPDQCGGDFWDNDQIVIKVPQQYINEIGVDVGAHLIRVERQEDAAISAPIGFDVIGGVGGPNVCQVVPSAGPAGTRVSIFGDQLGSQEGEVTFFRDQNAVLGDWQDDVIEEVIVPPAAQSGPVVVQNTGGFTSNSVEFTVADCREADICGEGERCCSDGTCRESCEREEIHAHLAYRFSTSPIPDNPRVAVACNDEFRSPGPWDGFSDAVCLNAVVTASFVDSQNDPIAMVPERFSEESIQVFRCINGGNAPCDELSEEAEPGRVSARGESSFVWTPNAPWQPESTYQVTLKGGDVVGAMRAQNGGFLEADFVWEFKTAGAQTFCQVGAVHLDPTRFTATEQGEEVDYIASPIASADRCQTLSCVGTTWDWNSSFDGAVLAHDARQDICENTVTAQEETPVGIPAQIQAMVTSTDELVPPSDSATLVIDFEDPQVVSFLPQCRAACTNAQVRARFNTLMNSQTVSAATVQLYECRNALCESGGLEALEVASVLCTDDACGQGPYGRQFDLIPRNALEEDTYYRVRLRGSIESNSGVPLSQRGSNFGEDDNVVFEGDYSWIFKTKTDGADCRVQRVRVSPGSAQMNVVGQRQEFVADAYGAPDECSTTGQLLEPAGYQWQPWTAQDDPDNVEDADVAGLIGDGSLVLTRELPRGCAGDCTHTGSRVTIEDAVCGRGGIETGEDCEIGSGCSESCLSTGSAACRLTCSNDAEQACTSNADCAGDGVCQAVGENCCGNGIVEPLAGEECDQEGQVRDGDGCSASCENEGSRAVGGVCGDGVLDYEPGRGGEDCDDGNTESGDGCSSQCLNEGSVPIAHVYATCGDGVINEDAEDCDDGNVRDGDGCSASCLHEGTAQCVFECTNEPGQGCRSDADCGGEQGACQPLNPVCCGDGQTDVGEDCDGEDGCGSSCLWEGASAFHARPSFCGDAQIDAGEECEAARLDRAAIGPYAVSYITSDAPQEVIAGEEGRAYSVVTATAEVIEGQGRLILECSCTSDATCGDSSVLGCGEARCCFDRPEVDAVMPLHNQEGLCRNTGVWIDVSQAINPETLFNGPDRDRLPNAYLELRRIGDVPVNEDNQDNCPDNYIRAIVPTEPAENLLVRLWDWISGTVRGWFGQKVSAERFACVVPLTHDLVRLEEGAQRIHFNYSELLLANAVYRLALNGDPDETDDQPEGVLSTNGVGFAFGGSRKYVAQFFTGDQICEVDEVVVEDHGIVDAGELDEPSIGLFTTTGEVHGFESYAYSLANAPLREVLQPIEGVYDWDWQWDTQIADADESANVVTAENVNERETTVVSVGNNGDEIVSATAVIEDRRDQNQPDVRRVTGGMRVTAFLCENPWPRRELFPYHETETNFSFSYCRDRGEEGLQGDLPGLTIVDEIPQSPGDIVREYLFLVEGTADAIGVRVIPNTGYLAPDVWYREQGFVGNPGAITLDGYEGLRDGNTLYVFAANRADDRIYPNMYVISFNEGAESDSQEIFDEILRRFEFNANVEQVSDWGVCVSALDPEEVIQEGDEFVRCEWDGDCGAEAICHAKKRQLRRDTRRLTDLVRAKSLFDTFGVKNRHCSVTSNQRCVVDSQCPGDETCRDDVPELAEGSFIRTMSVSTWPSWTAELGNALADTLPVDPLNAFRSCPEGFDSVSCFNANETQFVCSEDSHVYGFRSSGGESYELYASLEFADVPWAHPIDPDTRRFPDQTTDNVALIAEFAAQGSPGGFVEAGASAFCAGDVLGDSRICGDGVRGTGENFEVCEIGDTDRQACTAFVCANENEPQFNGRICDPEAPVCGQGGACVEAPGTKARACVNDDGECRYQTLEESPSPCIPFICGNGIIESQNGEVCDDGPLNGTYGHCGVDCTIGGDVFFCGDGVLGGGEQCDCGTDEDARVNGAWSALNCDEANGQYSQNYDRSCRFDCTFPGPSCGDGEINGGEQCDGNREQHAGRICSEGEFIYEPCETTSDCGNGGVCGGGIFDACAPARVCETGLLIGKPCQVDADCASEQIRDRVVPGQCGAFERPLTRTRTCTSSCEWREGNPWNHIEGAYCLGQSICGDGQVQGEEQCDDGNDEDNDGCTNACRLNVCGDGHVYEGVESCDSGDQNGQRCQAPYGNTCNFCDTSCQYQTVSGAFCGDGIINGHELCDGSAIRANCVDLATGEIGGSCDPLAPLEQILDTCGEGFGCGFAGACNGGDRNGLTCGTFRRGDGGAQGLSCIGGGECVTPICGPDCGSSCPTQYQTDTVLAIESVPGAQPSEVVDLFSANRTDQPNAATLQIPACEVGVTLKADIDKSNVSPPTLDILFLTDLSGSMGSTPEGDQGAEYPDRRIDVVIEATKAAIDDLFRTYDSLGASDRIRVALASYQSVFWRPDSREFNDTEGGFLRYEHKQDLLNMVNQYGNDIEGATPTHIGLTGAIGMFADEIDAGRDNSQKIIVLLSDGRPSVDADRRDGVNDNCDDQELCAREIIELVDEAQLEHGIQFYTAAITDRGSLIGYMAHFSSDECTEPLISRDACEAVNGVEYAYDAQTADGVFEMYETIIDTIVGSVVTLLVEGDGETVRTDGEVRDGPAVTLPFPEGFSCNGQQTFVPLSLTFKGEGPARLSNIKFTYCPAR